jgi:AraC family transcriptional regulator of adaptative response/methylated-DNA-[protein]-cysteine methyltransferase
MIGGKGAGRFPALSASGGAPPMAVSAMPSRPIRKETIEMTQDIETIRYSFADTKLDIALVATSDKGLVAVLLGDDRARLRRDLATMLPDTRPVEDQAALADTIAKVVALIDTPGTLLDLPLDLRGSEIERAVWEALTRIPVGETTTYGAIAKALPVPATAQDVGAACGANRIALAIPCHRVVKADGSISGYRWGVQRKRRLINMEGVA